MNLNLSFAQISEYFGWKRRQKWSLLNRFVFNVIHIPIVLSKMKHVGQETDTTCRPYIHFRRFMRIIRDSLKSVSCLVVSKQNVSSCASVTSEGNPLEFNKCPIRCDCIQLIIFLQAALHVSGVDIHHQELVQLQLQLLAQVNWICYHPLSLSWNSTTRADGSRPVWPTPEAVITVVRPPDDGCQHRNI